MARLCSWPEFMRSTASLEGQCEPENPMSNRCRKPSRCDVGMLCRLSALALFTLAFLNLAPTPAFAHGDLLRSEPASGERLSLAPDRLRLSFSESVELAFTRLAVTGPNGPVSLGSLMTDADSSRVLIAAIEGRLTGGQYTVQWQVAGDDGHPVRGEFTFSIDPDAVGLGMETATDSQPSVPAPSAMRSRGFPTTSSFGAESPMYAAVRWLNFVGLLGVIGTVAFRFFVLGVLQRAKDPNARSIIAPATSAAIRVGTGMAAMLLAALTLRLIAQSYAVFGTDGAWDPSRIASLLSASIWGWGWLLQAMGILIAFGGFVLARGRRATGWWIAALGAVGLAFTPALSGHAVATPDLTTLAVFGDGLHVLGAGGWLGSLLLVVTVGLPTAITLDARDGGRGHRVALLINAFSPTALVFAGTVVATGLFTAWLQLGSVAALWQSAYGQTLLLKIALLSVVFGTGAYNWLKVKPTLGEKRAASRLRRSAWVELATGAAVLAVTAFLVATPTPPLIARSPDGQGDPTKSKVASTLVSADQPPSHLHTDFHE